MGDRNGAVTSWRERRLVGMLVTMAVRQRCPWMRMWMLVLFSHTLSLQSRQQRAGQGEGEH